MRELTESNPALPEVVRIKNVKD